MYLIILLENQNNDEIVGKKTSYMDNISMACAQINNNNNNKEIFDQNILKFMLITI